MKKIISIALLLAMVLGIFAACGNQDATKPATDDLDSAVAYLKNMYDKSTKDEVNKLTADKELVPAVTIGGVSYPVSWTINVTSGPKELVVMAAGTAAGTQKIDLVSEPEEEIRFTLVGTVSDANGATKTIEIKFYSPAVQKADVTEGQKVVIYMVSDGKYMTGIDYLYTSSSGTQKHELCLTSEKAEALPLTLQTNDDGTITFVTDGGLYLFCDATHVMFVEEQGDYTKFILDPAEGGQYIKCAVANYSGKPQYLEVYSGYMTCYGLSETSNTALYIFELQDAEGANGTIGEPAAPCEHKYVDGTCTECGAADPNYVAPAEPQLPEITAPAAGTAYKFGMIQVTNGTTVYVTGEVSDRYLVTTTDMAAAADVYVEEADGGYKFYILVDGVKSYIYIYNNDEGKRSVAYGAEGNVFVFNADCGNWVTTFDGKECYLGSYNNFETVSVSDTSYINAENAGIKQFPAGFFTATEVPADLAGQIAAAGALANGEYLPYISTITGTITDEPKASSRTEGQFKFTVSDGTNTILCYYVPVSGGTPATGDTVTVTGYLTAYNGSAQFNETASAVLATEEVPAEAEAPFANGDQIVIYATSHNKALSTQPSSEGSYYQMGVDVTVGADGTLSGYAATEVWTVIVNADGTYSFSYNGQNLGMQDSFSSMSLGAVNDKWELVALDNGSYALKNVARGNYIEWYASKNNWSTYTTDDLLANDLFHLSFFIVA